MTVTLTVLAVVGFPIALLVAGAIREFYKNRAQDKPTVLDIHVVMGYKYARNRADRKYKQAVCKVQHVEKPGEVTMSEPKCAIIQFTDEERGIPAAPVALVHTINGLKNYVAGQGWIWFEIGETCTSFVDTRT